MSFEDELRDTMRAHDGEAPSVGDLPERPWTPRPRLTWLPLVAAAAVVAVIVGGALLVSLGGGHRATAGSSAPGRPPASLSCPRRIANVQKPTVPAAPDGVDRTNRLVPDQTPASVIVCAYLEPDHRALTGTARLAGDLGAVASSLTLLPRQTAAPSVCAYYKVSTDDDDYLVGLTYPTGTVWVSAPGNHCAGASNGVFRTTANLGAYVNAAYRAGHWVSDPPPLDPLGPSHPTGCTASSPGRLGQDSALVPGTPTSVLVCVTGSDAGSSRNAAKISALVSALDRLPTTVAGLGCKKAPTRATDYSLRFGYATGPDVSVLVMPDCHPSIDNQSLQSDDVSTVLPLIQALTVHR